jgi:hypothetical protein
MNCNQLTKILGDTINSINNDTIKLDKAQALVKASNSLIKLQTAKLSYNKITKDARNIEFFK